MGKRARQQKRRAQKRKKRRVTFGTAAATKVIPASDPARASGPDRSRRRGGSDGHRERSASAAAQRGPAAAEADVVAQVAHAIEDALVRQVEALVVAECEYDAARHLQHEGGYVSVSSDPAREEKRKARRLPRQVQDMRRILDARNTLILPSLPRRPGPCACRCCTSHPGPYSGQPHCASRRCCRRWSRSLPRASSAYASDDEDDEDDAGPASVCAAAAAGPEDAFAAPVDAGYTDYGYDEFGFEMEPDDAYYAELEKLHNKNEPAAAASSAPDGTSDAAGTSASSDDGGTSDSDDGDDRIYSLWGEDALTHDFYEEYDGFL